MLVWHNYQYYLAKVLNSKHAVTILLVVSFVEAWFLMIPPDAILIPLCMANTNRSIYYALLTTVSSVVGGLFGYLLGSLFFIGLLQPWLINWGYQDSFIKFNYLFEQYGNISIIIAAITPIPYKIVSISDGVFSYNIWQFILFSFIGRGARFFLVAGLIKHVWHVIFKYTIALWQKVFC